MFNGEPKRRCFESGKAPTKFSMPDLSKTEAGWYCFKALPKKEHIAAILLSKVDGVEALCPRISFFKQTKRGKVRFIESLFPGYVFIKADLVQFYRIIRSTQGIRDVVAFGDRIPMMPEVFIDDLRRRVGEDSTKELPEPVIEAGQDVVITDGPFKDIQALVTGGLDGRQRVALLLDFLGRQMEVSVPVTDVVPEHREPKTEVWES